MAYTITLTSSAQKVNDSDYLQMIITFTVDQTGANASFSFAEKGLRISDWGESEMSYDLEDSLLVPATYRCTLTDAKGYLLGLLFGTDGEGLNTKKNPSIEVKLNGSTDYLGIVPEDGIDYDKGNLQVSFTVDPNTSILNKTQLYSDEGAALNPFNLPFSGVMPLKDAILKAYQLVNPDVSLNISHDWLFTGVKTTSPNNVKNDITFNELLAYPQSLVYRRYSDVSNVGDFLRKLAIDFCAFTGMSSFSTAFFNKLFCYDPLNTQTMGLKLSHKLKYWYQIIDYVYVKLDIPAVTTWEYSQGTENIYIPDGNLKRQLFTGFRMKQDYSTSPFPSHDTQMQGLVARGSGTDGTYELYAVKDSSLDEAWRDNGDLVSRFWYKYRHEMPRMRIDSMSFKGITYTFLKCFNLEGGKYQIIKMKKLYSKNTTEIDAIFLGVL